MPDRVRQCDAECYGEICGKEGFCCLWTNALWQVLYSCDRSNSKNGFEPEVLHGYLARALEKLPEACADRENTAEFIKGVMDTLEADYPELRLNKDNQAPAAVA